MKSQKPHRNLLAWQKTMDFTVKKGGKVTANGRVVVAADGRSRTVTVSGTDAKGKKFKNIAVFDKQ